jgi:hypothetical protein
MKITSDLTNLTTAISIVQMFFEWTLVFCSCLQMGCSHAGSQLTCPLLQYSSVQFRLRTRFIQQYEDDRTVGRI